MGRVFDLGLTEVARFHGWPDGFDGDQRIERSVNTWSGLRGWESDPELMKARLVIGGVNHALTNLMRTDSRFRLVYEDSIAVVFVASTNGVESN